MGVDVTVAGDELTIDFSRSDAQRRGFVNNVYAGTVSVANRLLRANVSVGTANYPDDHLYPKELMILADQRMQHDRLLRRPPAA